MQSLSTFPSSQWKIWSIRINVDVQQDLDSISVQSVLEMIPRSRLCVEIQHVKDNFKTQTESMVISLSDWTEVKCLSAPLYILSICIEHRQAGQHKESQNGLFYTRSPWGAEVLNEELCCPGIHLQSALSIVLASDCTNASSVIYESWKDSY